ncbi:MAG: RNA polymerase sporulation sigma factor SigH [Lachnospiraceae bacterium]|jgi:RNA polymerase sporulation-specific sigma factor|nr:RNA polymerase sporulation sigma factor SigH [Lachnospiraceae bacterium]
MNEGYKQFSDEELMDRLRDGEEAITDFIMEKYKNLVRSKAKTMFLLGADSEDLIQEGMIGLFKAIRDYDSGRDASFFTFADLCISRQMYTAIQASRRYKHMPLNTYISLYGSNEKGESGSEENELINAIASASERSPEELLIDKENVENLERTIEKELSPLEKQVLELYLVGMKYTEIARILGKDDKSTDNALTRIKIKLKKALGKFNISE